MAAGRVVWSHFMREFVESLAISDDGKTALTYLRSGLKVNAVMDMGLTPLTAAVFYGQHRVVKKLISAGADVNLKDKTDSKWTPLVVASMIGWVDITKTLLAAGASPHIGDKLKATPLHQAAAMGFVEICSILLAKGAEVSAKNAKQGATPLQIAVMNAALGETAYLYRSMEQDLAREGYRLPPRARQDYPATVTLLLKQGLGRKEITKAAMVARNLGSNEMAKILTFHGTR